ncbi:uncharacterized protein [Physcomitrium patens]
MLLIDCVLRSLIVCCGRGWWLQKLLLSTDLLQVILTAMFSWARGSCARIFAASAILAYGP